MNENQRIHFSLGKHLAILCVTKKINDISWLESNSLSCGSMFNDEAEETCYLYFRKTVCFSDRN